MTREGTPIRYLRAHFLGDDEVCFHLYEAVSPELVQEASRRAAIPVERVAEALDIDLDVAAGSRREERIMRRLTTRALIRGRLVLPSE